MWLTMVERSHARVTICAQIIHGLNFPVEGFYKICSFIFADACGLQF